MEVVGEGEIVPGGCREGGDTSTTNVSTYILKRSASSIVNKCLT